MRKKELLNSIENPDAQLAMEAQAGNVDAEETLIRRGCGVGRQWRFECSGISD